MFKYYFKVYHYSEVTVRDEGRWRYVEFIVYTWTGKRYREAYREDRMLMLYNGKLASAA